MSSLAHRLLRRLAPTRPRPTPTGVAHRLDACLVGVPRPAARWWAGLWAFTPVARVRLAAVEPLEDRLAAGSLLVLGSIPPFDGSLPDPQPPARGAGGAPITRWLPATAADDPSAPDDRRVPGLVAASLPPADQAATPVVRAAGADSFDLPAAAQPRFAFAAPATDAGPTAAPLAPPPSPVGWAGVSAEAPAAAPDPTASWLPPTVFVAAGPSAATRSDPTPAAPPKPAAGNATPATSSFGPNGDCGCGCVDSAAVTGTVFVDGDLSGRQDAGEPGLAGVTVALATAAGAPVGTTTTAADGRYTFTGVPLGDYALTEAQPAGYASTTPDAVKFYLPAGGRTGLDFGDVTPGGWTFGQSGGTAGGHGTWAVDAGGFTLREGDSYTVWAERALTVPANPSTLTVRYTDLGFGPQPADRMNDAVEVSLVGADGRPLAEPFAPGREAAANLTAGQPAAAGPGSTVAAASAAAGTVTLDLSNVAPGVPATLRVRQVSNNGDQGSTVRVLDVGVNTAAGPKFHVADDRAGADFRYGADGAYQNRAGTTAGVRGVAANAAGTRTWTVDAGGMVRAYDPTGYLVDAWQAGGVSRAEDITVWGDDVWVLDAGAGQVREYPGKADPPTARPFRNGSFETLTAGQTDAHAGYQPVFATTPVPGYIDGWCVTAGSVDWIDYPTASGWAAADGRHSLDLVGSPGAGTIQQWFRTTPGVQYRVQYSYAGNPYGSPPLKLGRALVDGAAAQDIQFLNTAQTTPANMGWQEGAFTFTAAGAATTLAFQGLNGGPNDNVVYGLALDDVRVTPLGDESVPAQSGFTLAAGDADPTGLVTDGSKFWVTDRTAQKVFVYAAAGGPLGNWGFGPAASSPAPTGASPSAVFAAADDATQGSWAGRYGAAGYSLAQGPADLSGGEAVTVAGNLNHTWSSSTTEARALQRPGQSDRLAACWFSNSSFTVDVSPGPAARTVSLYLLDWDATAPGARQVRVEVLDPATGAVIDRRDVAGFYGGRYLTYTLNAPVRFRLTGQVVNAVLSGVFFDPPPSSGVFLDPPPSSAAFVGADDATQGSWAGRYGAAGYSLVQGPSDLPAGASVAPDGNLAYTWAASTADGRALQKPAQSDRLAACWYSPNSSSSFTVDVYAGPAARRVSLYLLDWDAISRSERVEVLDPATGAVLDSREASGFQGGRYLTWTVSGAVRFRLTNLAGGATNAVVSAVFLDPPPSSAAFVGADDATHGDWVGRYGTEGYQLAGAGGPTALPGWATLTPSGANVAGYNRGVTQPGGTREPGSADRGIGHWWTTTQFDLDLTLTDGHAHRVGLYAWDHDRYAGGRVERVQVLDRDTGAVLDSQDLSGFGDGRWLRWDVSGRVRFRVTNLGSTALINGLVLDPVPATQAAGLDDVTGITLDPTNASQDLWLVDNAGDRVVRYAGGRGRLAGTAVPATDGFRLAAGDFSPQGIADPPPAGQPDNYGTDFWLAFPHNNNVGHLMDPDAPPDQWLVYLTGSAVASSVRVEIPGQGFGVTVPVGAGQIVPVDLPSPDLGVSYDLVSSHGVHVAVLQGGEVAVYALGTTPTSTDMFLGRPVDVLGTDYRVLSYPNPPPLSPGRAGTAIGTELAVAATDDDTVVTVTPSVTVGSRTAGVPYTLTLNRGQTYQLLSDAPGADLTGTTVHANRKVAVFGGSSGVNVPATVTGAGGPVLHAEYVVEQLPPTDDWGTTFVAATSAPRLDSEDRVRVLAAATDTVVRVNGAVAATLAAGGVYEFALTGAAVVTTSRPALAAQFATGWSYGGQSATTGLGDPYMSLLTPLDRVPAEYTVVTPDLPGFTSNYVSVVARTADVGAITFDGSPVPAAEFAPVGDGTFAVARLGKLPSGSSGGSQVAVGPGTHVLTGAGAAGMAVAVYGFQHEGAYGYPGGFTRPVATALALTPATATVPVNGTHRLVARLTDAGGQPVAGTAVQFAVAGANPRTVSVTTDAAGRAELDYTGTVAGTDTVTATAAGQTASAAATWVTAPLAIQIVSPAGGSSFPAGQTVLVTGVATPSRDLLPIVFPVSSVTVNGKPVDALDATGRFFARVPVAAGANAFAFVATDVAGQTAAATLTLTGTKDRPGPVDFGGLTDLTRLVPEYARTAYDARTATLFADVAVRNAGGFPVDAPLVVAVRHLSDPTVVPADPDGVTPDGLPYWDFTGLVPPDGLAVASATGERTIRFTTPAGRPFTYELVVLARPNRPPVVSSVPALGARVNQPYRYQVAAADPDGDPVSFALSAGPAGMTVSPTGLVSWTPAAVDVGDARVEVVVTDGRGGRGTQTFALTVKPAGVNAPPVITSAPVVTAAVNRVYTYRVTAADPDGDPVALSVAGGPLPQPAADGTITWTPQDGQTGNYTITATATDGHGGRADQTFVLRVGLEPGNTAPHIWSTPPGRVSSTQPYRYQVVAKDDDGDPLTYSFDGTPPAGIGIDAETGLITWASPVAATVTVRVRDGRGGTDTQAVPISLFGPGATVYGRVFEDASPTNGKYDVGESGLAGWVVYLDTNGDGRAGSDEPAATTAADGTYTIIGGPAGKYLIRQVRPDGWTLNQPAAGGYPITVADGTETFAGDDFANVHATPVNHPPALAGSPPLGAVAGQPYSFQFTAADPDNDPLAFDLPMHPAGMAVDPATGAITWTPRADQVGPQSVLARVADGRGGVDLRAFTVTVAPPLGQGPPDDTPPRITSTPPVEAAVGRPYTYAVRAEDAENDPLTFALAGGPAGMTVDPATGLVRWVPTADQLTGSPYTVAVVAAETANPGYYSRQTYTLSLSPAPPNHPPAFAPVTIPPALTGQPYTLPLSATDPDGDPLTYTLTDQPASPNGGAAVDAGSGLFTWTAGAVGSYTFAAQASDGHAAAAYRFTVPVRASNGKPVIQPAAGTSVGRGNEFRFDALASDPDGDPLTYTLTGLPGGTVSDLGQVRWPTAAAGLATYTFTLVATDPLGAASDPQSFAVTVTADVTPPAAAVAATPDTVDIGQTVRFVVTAADTVGVAGRTLTVTLGGSSQTVPLNANGEGEYVPQSGGTLTATATATDAAGNTSPPATATVSVIDPTVSDLPEIVDLANPADANGQVFAPTALTGTAKPRGTPTSFEWKLEYLPPTGGVWQPLGAGTNAVANGPFGVTFDPTRLPNGSYTIRLSARQNAGNFRSVTRPVQVNGRLKLGDLTLSATDLTVPVAGIPITVSRSYDSLRAAGGAGDFGPGWRLELGGYQTAADPATVGEDYGGYPAFRDGTRVSVRRPDGQLDWYTFQGSKLGFASPDYIPEFVPDAGVLNRLSVDTVFLRKTTDASYTAYAIPGAPVYNPARPELGGAYDVTEPSGVVYTVDARTGDLMSAHDRNDNKLTFADDGIASNRGRNVTFERDNFGRITALVDPRGNRVRYSYDAAGDLAAVTDRLGVQTAAYTYRPVPAPAHYLETVTDALGTRALTAAYAADNRLASLTDAAGATAALAYTTATAGAERGSATTTTTFTDATGQPKTAVSTVALDARGNPVRAVDPVGQTSTVEYGSGPLPDSPTKTVQVVGLPDAQGGPADDLITTVEYDTRTGLPVATTGPYTTATAVAARPVSRTRYNALNLPETVADPLGNATTQGYDDTGNLTATRSAEGVTAGFSYDAHGNLKTVTRAGATSTLDYLPTGEVRASTDPSGNTSTFAYDANGNRTGGSRTWVNPADPADTRTLTTAVEYDAADRPVASTDELGLVTRTAYDRLGRAVKTTDPHGNVSQTVFDARGLAVEARSPDGTVTRTVYDEQGRAVLATDPFVPGPALAPPVRATRTVYDAAGRVTETDRLDGAAVAVSVSGTGLGTSAVAAPGTVLSASTTEYDAAGRAFRTTQFAGGPAAATTTTYFDGLGRAVGSKDALGNQTKTDYDAAGRAVTQWDALGQPTATVYDGDGRAVKTVFADGAATAVRYDANGRKVAEVDAVGQETDYGYDALGRLTTVTQPAVPDPLQGGKSVRPVTTYGYDGYGNRTSVTDANGHVTTFTFDAYGRQTGRALPAVGGVAATETTAYTPFGEVDHTVDLNGTRVDTTYDYEVPTDTTLNPRGTKLGRVVRTTWTPAAGSTALPQAVLTRYDDFGRANQVSDTTGSQPARVTATDYDVEGRVVHMARPEGDIRYAYDPATGRQTAMWTDFTEVDSTYDLLGRPLTLTEAKRAGVALAAADRLVTAYGYDPVGDVQAVTVTRNGAAVRATTNSYDPKRHWLQSVTNSVAGGAASSFQYTRRADGQVSQVTDTTAQPGGGSQTQTITYAYDAMDRLIQESEAGGVTRQYTLDLVGNRLSQAVTGAGTTTYTYDARDRLLTATTGGVTIASGYDAAGSLTTTTRDGVVQSTRAYDARGRLAAVRDGSGATTAGYQYTADGVRSAVSEGGVTTIYLIDGQSPSGYPQVVEERTASGLFVASYVYGAGLDPISMNRDAGGGAGVQPVLYLADGHSGVRQAVATGGAVLLVQRFDGFGTTVAQSNPTNLVNPIGYRGERLDPVTGEINLRARDYAPRVGRFTSQDQFMGNYGDPSQVMRYGYAGANPMAGMDPSGLAWEYNSENGQIAHLAFSAFLLISHSDIIPTFDFSAGAVSQLVIGQNIFGNSRVGDLKPDAISFSRERYYELKPISQKQSLSAQSRQQLESYRQFNNYNIFAGNQFGITFGLPQIPIGVVNDGTQWGILWIQPSNATTAGDLLRGVIFYYVTKLPPDESVPSPTPIPVQRGVGAESISRVQEDEIRIYNDVDRERISIRNQIQPYAFAPWPGYALAAGAGVGAGAAIAWNLSAISGTVSGIGQSFFSYAVGRIGLGSIGRGVL